MGYGAFVNISNDAKFFVPSTSVDTYKAADGWKDYAGKIEGHNFE